MSTESDLYVGKEPATFEYEGSPVFIGPTIVVHRDHPIRKGREDLFTPLVVHFDLTEQAEPAKPVKAKPGPAAK